MKRWTLREDEKQELESLGWTLGGLVAPDSITQNANFLRLLELEQNHIFWGGHTQKSLIVVLDGRGGGRDLFKSIGETKLLISILRSIVPEKQIRLVRIFSCPKTSEARFWLDIIMLDKEFSSTDVLIRFDDCFLHRKAGEEEPAEIKRTQFRFSQSSTSAPATRTYRNLFGAQSERVLKYYILAGCKEAGGKDLEFPTSLNHLAELTGVPQSSVSRTFAALEEQGFVYRRVEKRSLLPQIIAGRRLMDAWWESQMQKILSGSSGASRSQEIIYLRDPSPLKDDARLGFLEKDITRFLDEVNVKVEVQEAHWALSGQLALRLLRQSISNEESIVVHARNFAALNILAKELSLVPASKKQKGILVVRLQTEFDRRFFGLQEVAGHNFWTVDGISLYLDTAFTPTRSSEQREYLLEKIFAPHFKIRGWRL